MIQPSMLVYLHVGIRFRIIIMISPIWSSILKLFPSRTLVTPSPRVGPSLLVSPHLLASVIPFVEKAFHTISLTESKASDLIKIESPNHLDLITLTRQHMIRVYPGGKRQDSSNLHPPFYWTYGKRRDDRSVSHYQR